MSPRKFDRFMVDVHIAANPKLARLNPAERWCLVGGVLSLAALAPVRGRLLIGDQAAEVADVAHHARVTAAVARSTLEKLRRVGMIVPDAELECERVHDFEEWNPGPKNDPTNADRQRRYRERRRNARNGAVTAAVTPGPVTAITPPEVEREVEEEESSGGATNENARRMPPPLPHLKRVSTGRAA